MATVLGTAVAALPAPASALAPPSVLFRALQGAAALEEGGVELTIEPADAEAGEVSAGEEPSAWVELTPLLVDGVAPIVLWRRDPRAGLGLAGLARGPVLACAGGGRLGVTCRRLYLPAPDAGALVVAPGLPAVGRYRLDDLPLAGARVAVVPADLETQRPFTMPLGTARDLAAGDGVGDIEPLGGSRALLRTVTSDADGRFRLPPLAPGRYRLETLLPTGRMHHSAPFDLPALDDARRRLGAFEVAPPAWDLGDFDVADGLALTVRAHRAEDEDLPLAGVAVSAVEGTALADALVFQGHTDTDGELLLSGFSAERPGYLSCRADGFRGVTVRWRLVPPLAACPLERLAALIGTVAAADGTVPAGATVRLLAPDEAQPVAAGSPLALVASIPALVPEVILETPPSELPARVDDRGTFRLQLPAGAYRLEAAAPGFVTETLELVFEPGIREALEPIVLLPAREPVEGLVVDAETGAPIAGVDIVALEPAGAVAARSDPDGVFLFPVPDDEPVRLRAQHPGYAPAEVVLRPQDLAGARFASDREGLVIELARGGEILVVMWDAESGETCRGCPVLLHPGGELYRTDATGEVMIGPLAPARYRVERPRVHHLGSVAIEQPEGDVRHAVVRTGGIAPVWFGERRRSLRLDFRPGLEDGWLLSARSGRRAQRRFPEADGSFVLEQERDEDLTLYLERFDAASGAPLVVRAGRLPAGGEIEEVTLRLPATEVRGRARVGGEMLAGVRVRLLSLIDRALGARAVTDPSGRFLLPHVQPGIYAFEVGERTVRFVRVETAGTVDLGELDLPIGGFTPAQPLAGALYGDSP